MKKTIILLFAFALVGTALITSCEKEEHDGSLPDGFLELVTTGYGGNQTKTTVDGTATSWKTGDCVVFLTASPENNKDTFYVTVNGGKAYVRKTNGNSKTPTSDYIALYPNTITPGNSIKFSSGSMNITIPRFYTYSTDGGNQVLNAPLYSTTQQNGRVFFRHLTAALVVQVKNSTGNAITIDNVTVTSNMYQLSGVKTVTNSQLCASGNVTFDANSSPSREEDKHVTVSCANLGSLADGSSANIQVPILPVGADNKFTIYVKAHETANANKIIVYERTQSGTAAIGMGQLGYTGEVALTSSGTTMHSYSAPSGKYFSVSPYNRYVVFSPGNLQYRASDQTWRFAAHQYDYIGNAAGNTTAEASRASQADYIDLFGWGTSGWANESGSWGNTNSGRHVYEPWSIDVGWGNDGNQNSYRKDVGSNVHIDSTSDFANGDWCWYNTIGSDDPHTWRTLSEAEWLYVVDGRPNAANLMGFGQILVSASDTVRGFILLPDNWELPAGCSFTGSKTNYTTNSYTLEQWSSMESNGAVFLPAAGSRNGLTYNNANQNKSSTNTFYWSTRAATGNAAYRFGFNCWWHASLNASSMQGSRHMGHCVRAVKNVYPSVTPATK